MVDVILHHHDVVLGVEQREEIASPSHETPFVPSLLQPPGISELREQGDGGLTLYLRSIEE